MWQSDTVKKLVRVNTTGYAGTIVTWTETGGTDAVVDVQDINKEVVFKEYGILGNEFKQVFDHRQTAWTKGEQIKYGLDRYWIKLVNANMGKMGLSNHTFVILEKVV
jgi:hypothetical protein